MSKVNKRNILVILKLAPIYFRFQGRQGHFNVPESVKNNKKLTLKLCWLSLIKAVFCLLCFIGPICIWLQWMSVRLPGTQTSSRHSENEKLKVLPQNSDNRDRWADGGRKKHCHAPLYFKDTSTSTQFNLKLEQEGFEFEFIKHSNKAIVGAFCVGKRPLKWDQCYTFEVFLCNKLIALV